MKRRASDAERAGRARRRGAFAATLAIAGAQQSAALGQSADWPWADCNCDGFIDSADSTVVTDNWSGVIVTPATVPPQPFDGDVNGDGAVNYHDLNAVLGAAGFGDTTPDAPAYTNYTSLDLTVTPNTSPSGMTGSPPAGHVGLAKLSMKNGTTTTVFGGDPSNHYWSTYLRWAPFTRPGTLEHDYADVQPTVDGITTITDGSGRAIGAEIELTWDNSLNSDHREFGTVYLPRFDEGGDSRTHGVGDPMWYFDFVFGGVVRDWDGMTQKVAVGEWPGNRYAPVNVLAGDDYMVGVSVMYPVLETKHTVNQQWTAIAERWVPSVSMTNWYDYHDHTGHKGWEADLKDRKRAEYEQALLQPGEEFSIRIAIVVVETQPNSSDYHQEMMHAIQPYKRYFYCMYGSAEQRYSRDARGVYRVDVAAGGAGQLDGHTFVTHTENPRDDGWNDAVIDAAEARRSTYAWHRMMIARPTGSYGTNQTANDGAENMPSEFASPIWDSEDREVDDGMGGTTILAGTGLELAAAVQIEAEAGGTIMSTRPILDELWALRELADSTYTVMGAGGSPEEFDLGLWWGRSGQYQNFWGSGYTNPATDPTHLDNVIAALYPYEIPADLAGQRPYTTALQDRAVSAMLRELDYATPAASPAHVGMGGETIGLDAATVMRPWDAYWWILEMRDAAPDTKFVVEPYWSDIHHAVAGMYLLGYEDGATPFQEADTFWTKSMTDPMPLEYLMNWNHPHYIADLLNPGHETWVEWMFPGNKIWSSDSDDENYCANGCWPWGPVERYDDGMGSDTPADSGAFTEWVGFNELPNNGFIVVWSFNGANGIDQISAPSATASWTSTVPTAISGDYSTRSWTKP